MKIETKNIEFLIEALLIEIGEDPKRDGLIDTPKRVAKYWKEFIEYEPGKIEQLLKA